MSLKNYIFSSINTKGAQDSDKFATIRLKSLRVKKMAVSSDDNPAPIIAHGTATQPEMNDSTNARQSDTTVATSPSRPDEADAKHMHTDSYGNANKKPEEFNCSWFFFGKGILKIWSYITVEPLMLCWLLPSCFLFIAVENLALEKVSANQIPLVI